MDISFINNYRELKRNNELSLQNIENKFANQELDEAVFINAKKNINNNYVNFCKSHLKLCNDFLKEKLDLEINIYIQINEFDFNLKEIQSLVVKNNKEFEQDSKKIHYQINNRFLDNKEKKDLETVFEIIETYHKEVLKHAPERQNYAKIKAEVELTNSKRNTRQLNITNEKKEPIKKVSFFYKFLPLIIFVIIILIGLIVLSVLN